MNLSALLDADRRPGVVSDLTSLAERGISEQSGVTGIAIKGAVAAAKKMNGDIVPASINRFLPLILGALQPFATDAAATGKADAFGDYLAAHQSEVCEALITLAESNIGDVKNPAVVKVFGTIKDKAERIIGPSLGELGSILQRHAQAA